MTLLLGFGEFLGYLAVAAIAAALLFVSTRKRREGEAGRGRRVGGSAVGKDESGPRPSAPPEEHAAWADRLWVPPGAEVEVAGLRLPGMVYVGHDLRPVERKRGLEPALIDPELPVDASATEVGERPRAYSSYEHCDEAERGVFLRWLQAGRRDPTVPIGALRLFFHGLERRALFETQHSEAARNERLALLAELDRLRELHDDDDDFAQKSLELRTWLELDLGEARRPADTPPRLVSSRELPFPLGVALARFAEAEHPLPWRWALQWLLHTPGTRLRTPARRCPEEFAALFELRYREKFGEGMPLPPTKTRLKISYRPSSPSFRESIERSTDLPDVASRVPPMNALRQLAEACCDELDSYSRQRGKEEGAPSLLALAQLPAPLVAAQSSPVLDEFRRLLHDSLDADSVGVVAGETLMQAWGEPERASLTKAQGRDLCQLVSSLGYAAEPDVRRGGASLRREESLVVFPAPEGDSLEPSRAYTRASRMLWIAAAVAGADGEVTENEERELEQQLESSLGLNEAEALRLRALLRWLLLHPPGLGGLKKKMEGVPAARRAEIGRFTIVLAGADGHLGKGEMRVLRRIYRALELEDGQLQKDIEGLIGPAVKTSAPKPERAAPTDVASSTDGTSVEAEAEEEEEVGFQLDMALVRAKLAETAEVSELLADVFADDEERRQVGSSSSGAEVEIEEDDDPEAEEDQQAVAGSAEEEASGAASSATTSAESATPTGAGTSARRYAGLDAAHSSLLEELRGRETLSAAEFEQLADARSLLPAGAQETLNQAAFDHCDAPVLEGDDPLEVLGDVLEEMLEEA